MIHLIYIYLIINSFIASNYLLNGFNDDKGFKKFRIFSVFFLFGVPYILLYLISVSPVFRWIKNEFWFAYHFYLTDYWKNAVENNKHGSKEQALEFLNNSTTNASKQVKRHNRLIQKIYGRNKILYPK